MGYIIPNYIYYACFGLATGLLMFLTFGTLYIKKVRNNMQVSFTSTGEIIPVTKNEKIVRTLILFVGLIGLLLLEYFLLPNGSGAEVTKTAVFGFGLCCFGCLSVLDIKYGEVYVYELGIGNTLALFIIPIVVDFIFGCSCIAKALLIGLGIYILMKIINYALNKELSIGGADIDTIAALLVASIALVIVINKREEIPILVESFFVETLLSIIFINFSLSILVYFIVRFVKKIKHKEVNEEQENSNSVTEQTSTGKSNSNDSVVGENAEKEDKDEKESDAAEGKKKKSGKMNFRCLPSFILIYSFVLFFVLFY